MQPSYCACILSLCTGLVVYGGSAGADEGHQLGWTDGVGVGIGFVSMLGMAVFYVYVQKTEGVIAEEHVLYVEYATMCLTLPLLSYFLESRDWGALLQYGWLGWGNLLFSSLGVRSWGGLPACQISPGLRPPLESTIIYPLPSFPVLCCSANFNGINNNCSCIACSASLSGLCVIMSCL